MSTVANFYAQVFFDINSNYREEILELQKAFTETEIQFFDSSLISEEKKNQVIKACSFPSHIQGFLNQLTLKRRWKYFSDICDEYLKLCDKKNSILRGIVYSIKPLSQEELDQTKNTLKNSFIGKKIVLENHIDDSLIQGIKVTIGGYSFDNTTSYHLSKFRAKALQKNY